MKNFDLIVVSGNKASQKQVFQMLSGKNSIGTNIKCSTQIDLDLIKPQHFELLVTKAGRITLIPLVGSMQLTCKNKKLKELSPNQCYELDLKQYFYVDRTYSFYIDESITKKTLVKVDNSSNSAPKSLWAPKQKQPVSISEPKKKVKKDEEVEEEENSQKTSRSESTQSKYEQSQNDDNDEEYEFNDDFFEEYEQEEAKQSSKTNKKLTKSKTSKSLQEKSIKSPNSCETTLIQEKDMKKSNNDTKKGVSTTKLAISKEEKSPIKQQKSPTSKQSKPIRVILSNCDLNEKQINKMNELGVVFVDNTEDGFDVVVMDGFRRRAKLLIGLNKQAWIINKNWILDCIDDNELIDDFCEYILEVSKEDQAKFEDFDLDIIQVENQKKKGNQIFKNCSFSLQNKYKHISVEDMEAIIKSGGGVISNGKNTPNKFSQIAILERENISGVNNPLRNTIYADPEYILLSSLKQQIQQQFIYKL